MKTIRKKLGIIVMAFLASACAGAGLNRNTDGDDSLFRTVPESFHFNIQDEKTRSCLAQLEPGDMPPGQRIEAIILRELASISNEEELHDLFDSLWERHEEIRRLVCHPQEGLWAKNALCEIYYILSSAPGRGWQEDAAERIYREALSKVPGSELSGYALHFYTMGLLINARFNVAISFLKSLEFFTPPQVYLDDLGVALGYAARSGEGEISCNIMSIMCRRGIIHDLRFPDHKMKAALMELKKAGKLQPVLNGLVPVIKSNLVLQKYEFARLIMEFEQDASENLKTDAQDSLSSGTDVAACHKETCHKEISAPAGVEVHIEVIRAERQSGYTDPRLAPIAETLRNNFDFSGFHLISDEKIYLTGGQKDLFVGPRGRIKVMLKGLDPGICRLGISVFGPYRKVLETVIESADGETNIIGGPQFGDRALFLRITTLFVSDDVSCKRIKTFPGEYMGLEDRFLYRYLRRGDRWRRW